MFGVAAISTHIPLPDGAVRAGDGIGMPNDADHDVAGKELRVSWRFFDDAQRLVSNDQALVTWRGGTVFAGDDLTIGSTDAERDCPYQHRSTLGGRYAKFLEPERIGDSRLDRQRPHGRVWHANGLCRKRTASLGGRAAGRPG